MAFEWIKMRCRLASDPTVKHLARTLKLDVFSVVGRLHAFWSWADEQTENGVIRLTTAEDIDEMVDRKGFAAALASPDVQWLMIDGNSVTIPNFERHNGESAKKRALDTERQRDKRQRENAEYEAQRHAQRVTDVPIPSRTQRDKSVTREEKIREEKSKGAGSERARGSVERETVRTLPPALAALGPRFVAAWENWLVDLTDRHSRTPTNAQCDSHLRTLLEFLERGEDPITAIENAIARRLREPALPKETRPRQTASKAPTVWELQQREQAIKDRMAELNDGKKGKTYNGNPAPGKLPGYDWTEAGKAEYERLGAELETVRRTLTASTPSEQSA